MKAKLLEVRVLPFDPMTLSLLPPGQHHVQVHMLCDREAAEKFAKFFRDSGFEGTEKFDGPREIPPKPKGD